MKGNSKVILSLLLGGLLIFSTNNESALAKSFSSSRSSSSSSSSKSTPTKSSPTRSYSSPSSSPRVNSVTNRGGQTTTTVRSNSSAITNPVRATYTPKSAITKTRPSSSTVVDKTFIAPNPQNKPTEKVYVTKYGSDNKAYTLQVFIPIGTPTNTIIIDDDYFPTAARSTVIYDNTNYGDSASAVAWIAQAAGNLVVIIVVSCVGIAIFRSFR